MKSIQSFSKPETPFIGLKDLLQVYITFLEVDVLYVFRGFMNSHNFSMARKPSKRIPWLQYPQQLFNSFDLKQTLNKSYMS